MQKFVNVRTTAESVKPLEIDDYHVYVNTGIKEINEEAKEGDLSSGFDGFEIETQEIYEKDEYIQLIAGLTDIIPRECSCNQFIQLAKNIGIWVENDAYTPWNYCRYSG